MKITSNLNQPQTNPTFKAHIINLEKLPEGLSPQVVDAVKEHIGVGFHKKIIKLEYEDTFVGFHNNKIIIAVNGAIPRAKYIITHELNKIFKSLGIENSSEVFRQDGNDSFIRAKRIFNIITKHPNGSKTEYQYAKHGDDFSPYRVRITFFS